MKVEAHHDSIEEIQKEVKKNLLMTGPNETVHCKHCERITDTKDYHCLECKQLKGHPYLESK